VTEAAAEVVLDGMTDPAVGVVLEGVIEPPPAAVLDEPTELLAGVVLDGGAEPPARVGMVVGTALKPRLAAHCSMARSLGQQCPSDVQYVSFGQ
jgi:hypothetical protein